MRKGGFSLRTAKLSDLELLVRHRESMWLDIGGDPEPKIVLSSRLYRSWLLGKMHSKRVVAFIIENPSGSPVASGGIWLQESLPSPHRLRRFTPYLMSVYTDPSYRRRGLATMVVKAAIDWCIRHGYDRLTLHASSQGKSVYTALGFEPTTEMRLELPSAASHPHRQTC